MPCVGLTLKIQGTAPSKSAGDLHLDEVMKSVVELNIDAPQEKVAELFEDPWTFPSWMDDLERIEPVSGSAMSRFRLVPKKGNLVFIARVVDAEPPHHARLALDAPTVSVSVTGRFRKLSDHTTRLVSEEIFHFKGLLGHLFGWLGRGSIRRAHRRHMESFKRFAESQ